EVPGAETTSRESETLSRDSETLSLGREARSPASVRSFGEWKSVSRGRELSGRTTKGVRRDTPLASRNRRSTAGGGVRMRGQAPYELGDRLNCLRQVPRLGPAGRLARLEGVVAVLHPDEADGGGEVVAGD